MLNIICDDLIGFRCPGDCRPGTLCKCCPSAKARQCGHSCRTRDRIADSLGKSFLCAYKICETHNRITLEITLSEGCGTVAAEISSSFAETLELSPVFPLKPGVDQKALHARLTPETELRLSNFPVH